MVMTNESIDERLDTAPCGFLSLSDDGKVVLANQTLAELVGVPAEEIRGGYVESILTRGSRVFYQTHLFPLLKLHGRAEEIYLTLMSRGGEEIPVLVNAVRRDRDGRPCNDLVLVRMQQRRLYEDAILEARREAEQANDAKEKFLSMMSHDLRTPLQAVSGYSDVLLAGFHGSLTEEQQNDVEHIKSATRRVVRMIDEILEFARIGKGAMKVELRTVSIREALSQAESMVRPSIDEAGLLYQRDDSSPPLAARADPDRLQQVLLNLLTNAIKFTPTGGSIRLGCDGVDRWVYLRVSDSGVGIPESKLPGVFDPFVQIQPDERGVGLGLAISRELTRAMGGDLSVESIEGEGSTFTIRLPRA